MPWLVLTAKAGGANALCGTHAIGYPGMPAFNGLSAVIAREVASRSGGSGVVRGFAVAHHSGHLRAYGKFRNILTHKRSVHDGPRRPEDGGFSTPMSVQPQIDLDFTLLVETDVPDAYVSRCADVARDGAPHPVLCTAPVRGLGGRLEARRASVADTFREALARTPPGLLLCDHTDELGDSEDPFDAMGRRTADAWDTREAARAALTADARKARQEPDADAIERGAKAKADEVGRVAMHVGWLSVCGGRRRGGTRVPGAEHHFVEAVTGLAAFRPRDAVLAHEPWRARWVPTIDRERGLFVTRAARP